MATIVLSHCDISFCFFLRGKIIFSHMNGGGKFGAENPGWGRKMRVDSKRAKEKPNVSGEIFEKPDIHMGATISVTHYVSLCSDRGNDMCACSCTNADDNLCGYEYRNVGRNFR